MPKFVVYEVWTRSKVVEARNYNAAIEDYEPLPEVGFHLCNWHAIPVDEDDPENSVVVIKSEPSTRSTPVGRPRS